MSWTLAKNVIKLRFIFRKIHFTIRVLGFQF